MLPGGASFTRGAIAQSLATDAVERGVHGAKRAITSVERGVEELAELKDEGVHRVRRHPRRAVGIALRAELVLGLAVGWIGRRPGWRE